MLSGCTFLNLGGFHTTGKNGGVVYCNRIQQRNAKFSRLNCRADLLTGVVTCSSPEELQLIQKTMSAAALNFVAPNVRSGINRIEVLSMPGRLPLPGRWARTVRSQVPMFL